MDFKEFWTKEELVDYDKASVGQRRVLLQWKVRNNFAMLVWMLGYRDVGAFHRREIEELGRVRKLRDKQFVDEKNVSGDYTSQRLWLWSRGFFKTSLITEAHTIYLILNNVDIRILITSNTIEIAKKIVANIKTHFMVNEDFRYVFKEWCPTENKEGKVEFGTTEQFTVPCRRRVYKEPTVMVAGVGTNLTGLHFDYIKPDDLVTRDSVTNDTQIEASKDYFRSLRQLFDNPSYPKMDVCGTIYHFNDLYCDLLKGGGYKVSKVPAIEAGVERFPERLNKESLDKILLDIGPYEFNTQYMLNPVNPSEAKLKEEWIKYYDELPSVLSEYVCVDPASVQKKKSDYTVIERWGIDWEGTHYLIDGVRDRMTAFERIDRLFEIVSQCKNLKLVKYEVLGGRHGDLEVIKERMSSLQTFFHLVETKSTTGSKEDRIEQRLSPVYHAGKVMWPRSIINKSVYDGKTYDFVQLLRLEYLQFPFTEHDDILDCQTQMFEEVLGKPSKPLAVKSPSSGVTADQWDKFYKSVESGSGKNKFISKNQLINKMKARRIKSIITKSTW